MRISFYKGLKYILQAVVGWFIVVPLSCLVPKQQDLVLFIGRDRGKFTDNVKHLFLYFNDKDDKNLKVYFLTQDENTFKLLNENSLPATYFPGIRSVLKMLRANTVVVDNWNWILGMKYYFLYNARKVQLWHGLPLKKIELDNKKEIEKEKSFILKLRNGMGGRFPFYDFFVSTSEFFTDNAFKTAFITEGIIETGYPRNDCLFNGSNENVWIGTDRRCIEKVKGLKENGYRIVVYTPTFRESGNGYGLDEIVDFDRLSEFAKKNNIHIVMKFHPSPDIPHEKYESDSISFYESSSDIYPLLHMVDVLVTDYSSIYFDYLLLNRPVVFFPYDYNKYIEEERDMYFDYEEMTPGPKCYTQEDLEKAIAESLTEEGASRYSEKRNEILEMAFKNKDGKSSERLWIVLREKLGLDQISSS